MNSTSNGMPRQNASTRFAVRTSFIVVSCAVIAACGGGGSSESSQAQPKLFAQGLTGITTSQWVAVPAVADPLIDGVTPTADAADKGMFSAVLPWHINTIHLAVQPDGKVMGFGPRGDSLSAYTYDVWDPSKGTNLSAHVARDDTALPDSFCGGMTFLSTGKMLLTTGGTGAGNARATTSYDPVTGARTLLNQNLAHDRWYSTMIMLPDGRPIMVGGMVPFNEPMYADPAGAINAGLAAMTPEIYAPQTGWRSLFGATSRDAFGPDFLRAEYPRAWVAPNGLLFGVSSEQMWFLDANAKNGQGAIQMAGAFKTGMNNTTRPNVGGTGSAVMYAPGKILKMGGNGYWVLDDALASNQTTIIDINDGTAKLTEVAPMNFARRFLNATVLPDGKVFVSGGTQRGNLGDPYSVYDTEMWSPETNTWTLTAKAARMHVYHSNAALLPNGTVMASGGGYPGPQFNTNAEVFYPPQLFQKINGKVEWAPRPVMAAVTSMTLSNEASFEIQMKDVAPVSQLVLMGLPSGTHSFNTGQRRIPLQFTQSGQRLVVTTPNVNLAPPGYYYVFAVNANGVSSRAVIVSMGSKVVPPTVPTVPYLPSKVTSPIPAPIIAAGATANYPAPALSNNLVDVSWNFGDGSPSTPYGTNSTKTHQYNAPGVYLVTVSMRDSTGIVSSYNFLQAINSATTANKPTSSTAIVVEPLSSGHRVWTVNPDNDSVSVLTPGTTGNLARQAEITVGKSPRTLALAPDGRIWVANKASATISIIDPKTLAVVKTITLPRASQPHSVVMSPDGLAAYVSLEASGQVLKLDPSTGATVLSVSVGANPRHLSVTANGGNVLVSRFITSPLDGENNAAVNTASGGGEVLVLSSSNMAIVKTFVLQHSDVEDGETGGSGIPNYLGAAVISPDGGSAWIPSKQDNIKRGKLRSGQNLNFQNTVRAITSRIDVSGSTDTLSARVDHDNSSLASAAVFHPSGAYLFVALETSREVAVINTQTSAQLLRFSVGMAPQGLALSPDSKTLYVQNFMDRTVTQVDLSPLTDFGKSEAKVYAGVASIATEKLSAQVLKGKQFFYDAKNPRLAKDSYMSCASCHNDGGQDGRVWDLTGFGEGLRNTINLRGRGGMGHGLLHWSGNFDEVQDFEGQIRNLAGGTGLMSDAAFNYATSNQTLGTAKAGASADLDALAAYVSSLNTFDASPNRHADGALTSAGLAGRRVFVANCASCHGGANFTLSANPANLVAIGTIKPSSGQRISGTLTGIDIPTLRDAWATAPYLHDGSAKTIVDAISAHTQVPAVAALSVNDLLNVAAYVQQIGGDETNVGPSMASTPVLDKPTSYGLLGSSMTLSATAIKPTDIFTVSYKTHNSLAVANNWVGVYLKVASGSYQYVTSQWAPGASGKLTFNTSGWATGDYYVYELAKGGYTQMLVPPVALTLSKDGLPVKPAPIADWGKGTGQGLLAEYFDNYTLTGAPTVKRNEDINFDWFYTAPVDGMRSDLFSARWTGQIEAPVSGDYFFRTLSDDGVRVWVNGVLLIDNYTTHWPTYNASTKITLVAGQKYAIKVEYFQYGITAAMQLQWMRPGDKAFNPIPVDRLYPTVTATIQ